MVEWLLFFVMIVLCFISRQLSVICGVMRYQTKLMEGVEEEGGPGTPVVVPKIKLVA